MIQYLYIYNNSSNNRFNKWLYICKISNYRNKRTIKKFRIQKLLGFEGLRRVEIEEAKKTLETNGYILENEIDLVIELPTVYALSSAENFADGAVKILNSLGVVDYISFGSEIGEIPTPTYDEWHTFDGWYSDVTLTKSGDKWLVSKA